MANADSRLVWDLPVRVTHWALVLAVAGCFATHYAGIEWFSWHRRLGYAVLVLVVAYNSRSASGNLQRR